MANEAAFGGIFSLDLDVPPVDLSVVLAGDALSPAGLTAAGVDCRVE